MTAIRVSRKPSTTIPLHPGLFVRKKLELLLGLRQTDVAKALGVSRITVNQLYNERRTLTASMALRLERAYPPHLSARHLLIMQVDYDLAKARLR